MRSLNKRLIVVNENQSPSPNQSKIKFSVATSPHSKQIFGPPPLPRQSYFQETSNFTKHRNKLHI